MKQESGEQRHLFAQTHCVVEGIAAAADLPALKKAALRFVEGVPATAGVVGAPPDAPVSISRYILLNGEVEAGAEQMHALLQSTGVLSRAEEAMAGFVPACKREQMMQAPLHVHISVMLSGHGMFAHEDEPASFAALSASLAGDSSAESSFFIGDDVEHAEMVPLQAGQAAIIGPAIIHGVAAAARSFERVNIVFHR